MGIPLVPTPAVVKPPLQPNRGYGKSVYKGFRGGHLVGSGGLKLCLHNTRHRIEEMSIVFIKK